MGDNTKHCHVCGMDRPKSAFSSKQWKDGGSKRKCLQCIEQQEKARVEDKIAKQAEAAANMSLHHVDEHSRIPTYKEEPHRISEPLPPQDLVSGKISHAEARTLSAYLPSGDRVQESPGVLQVKVLATREEGSVVFYSLQCRFGHQVWEIEKRYSDFDAFHNQVSDKFPNLPKLPPKKLFGNTNEDFVMERTSKLHEYLVRLLVRDDVLQSPILHKFMEIDQLPDKQLLWTQNTDLTDAEVLEKVVDIFEIFRKRGHNDEFPTIGKAKFKKACNFFVSKKQKITFLIPAFPFKSRNVTEKVLGDLPDKGEEVGLRLLNEFARLIGRIYPPSAEILLVSDGRIFSDLFQVSDVTVDRYNHYLHEKFVVRMPYITWLSLDLLVGGGTGDEIRNALMDQHGMSPEAVEEDIKSNSDTAFLYGDMKKFIREDLSYPAHLSGKQHAKMAGQIAKEVIRRNSAFSDLIAARFPDAVRLSIHPHSGARGKYGINLVPGGHMQGSPWHNSLVKHRDGGYELMKRKDAERKGYSLVKDEDGRPSYFMASIISHANKP